MSTTEPKEAPPITFSLDGVEHSTDVRKTTAAQVLETFAGLDPASYDLIRIVGHEEQRFHGSDEVELVPHGVYVSYFTGPMPVE